MKEKENKYPYPHELCDIGCYSVCTRGDTQEPSCLIEEDFECPMCGAEIEEHQDYCSRDCYKASWL